MAGEVNRAGNLKQMRGLTKTNCEMAYMTTQPCSKSQWVIRAVYCDARLSRAAKHNFERLKAQAS